jgi:hypothetical protein
MSLVHEALQKAEREKRRKSGEPPAAAVASRELPAHKQPWERPSGRANQPIAPTSMSGLPQQTAPAPPAKHSSGLLTLLIGCVAFVAIVAIVYLVGRAAGTIRESKEALATAAGKAAPGPAATSQRLPVAAEPAAAPDASAAYRVTGIMKDPEGAWCAVLNNRVVYEGHYVDGATVKKIERDRVTLDVAGRETVVRLF